MSILDRSIVMRFLQNFLTLFCLLFVFAVSIDVIVQFDEYVNVARSAVESGRFRHVVIALPMAVLDYHGPRVFQFFAYMVGLISVGAMAFTFAQMQRAREFVAILAAGMSLHRVGLAVVVAAFGLNLLQLANQELLLPRLAPALVRSHDDIFESGSAARPMLLTRDANGHLLSAGAFEPVSGTLRNMTVLERDAAGTATRRITATEARWVEEDGVGAWLLDGGVAIERVEVAPGRGAEPSAAARRTVVDAWETDLSPAAILARRSTQYAQTLSLSQIRALRSAGGVDAPGLSRLAYTRLAAVAVNLLVLVMALPTFLRREPKPLLQQSIACAVIALPGIVGAFLAMSVPLPGISPALAVFMPVALLLPMAAHRMLNLKT